jgi:uncharacterized protein involved in exopolysaccharide biosynthesis
MDESPQSLLLTPEDNEIGFSDLIRVLWAFKWMIVGISLAAAVIAAIVALMLPDIYRAEALLAPNDQEGSGGLSALASQYGGLASLAGINLSGGQPDKTGLGLEILKSRKFISEFVERHDLLVPLIAAKGWDPETGDLIIDSDDYDPVSNEWIRDVRPPKKTIPSMQEAYEAFEKVMSLSQDKNSRFVTLAISYYSPDIARQWVDWLVEDINSTIMQKDVSEAEQAIEFLNKQIESTALADLRSVFFGLIEEQTKTVMLAKVSDEYLLKTLDPAIAPEKRSKPNRILIVILGTILGFMISVIAVMVLFGRSAAWQSKFRKEND